MKQFTVIPHYLAPRYLAKLASLHMNAQDGFLAMYFASISRHPRLSPSAQPARVLPHVIWLCYVATFGRSAAAETATCSVGMNGQPLCQRSCYSQLWN